MPLASTAPQAGTASLVAMRSQGTGQGITYEVITLTADAQAAHEYLEENSSIGKVTLLVESAEVCEASG